MQLKEWFLDPLTSLANKGSHAEVDYVIMQQNQIIPVEVKSGHGATLQSMRIFLKSHSQSFYGIRFSTQSYSLHEDIHSYPLYAVSGIAENKERSKVFVTAKYSSVYSKFLILRC